MRERRNTRALPSAPPHYRHFLVGLILPPTRRQPPHEPAVHQLVHGEEEVRFVRRRARVRHVVIFLRERVEVPLAPLRERRDPGSKRRERGAPRPREGGRRDSLRCPLGQEGPRDVPPRLRREGGAGLLELRKAIGDPRGNVFHWFHDRPGRGGLEFVRGSESPHEYDEIVQIMAQSPGSSGRDVVGILPRRDPVPDVPEEPHEVEQARFGAKLRARQIPDLTEGGHSEDGVDALAELVAHVRELHLREELGDATVVGAFLLPLLRRRAAYVVRLLPGRLQEPPGVHVPREPRQLRLAGHHEFLAVEHRGEASRDREPPTKLRLQPPRRPRHGIVALRKRLPQSSEHPAVRTHEGRDPRPLGEPSTRERLQLRRGRGNAHLPDRGAPRPRKAEGRQPIPQSSRDGVERDHVHGDAAIGPERREAHEKFVQRRGRHALGILQDRHDGIELRRAPGPLGQLVRPRDRGTEQPPPAPAPLAPPTGRVVREGRAVGIFRDAEGEDLLREEASGDLVRGGSDEDGAGTPSAAFAAIAVALDFAIAFAIARALPATPPPGEVCAQRPRRLGPIRGVRTALDDEDGERRRIALADVGGAGDRAAVDLVPRRRCGCCQPCIFLRNVSDIFPRIFFRPFFELPPLRGSLGASPAFVAALALLGVGDERVEVTDHLVRQRHEAIVASSRASPRFPLRRSPPPRGDRPPQRPLRARVDLLRRDPVGVLVQPPNPRSYLLDRRGMQAVHRRDLLLIQVGRGDLRRRGDVGEDLVAFVGGRRQGGAHDAAVGEVDGRHPRGEAEGSGGKGGGGGTRPLRAGLGTCLGPRPAALRALPLALELHSDAFA
ncbi:hypothetical protein ACHAWF_013838, partial [Thalassiosira exigua]